MSKILDSLKHAIIEDDDPKSAGSSAAPAEHRKDRAAQASDAAAPAASAVSSQPMGEDAQRVYRRILAATNFDTTEVAATIHKYLDPLSAIASLDDRTRFKTAVVQAKAQEGLSAEKILGTFEGLKVALANEQKSFAAAEQDTEQDEIVGRQKKVKEISDTIAQKQKEIVTLQERLATVTNELTAAQAKVQHAQAQFAIAAQRRALELDQEKAKYASLLQG